MSLITALELMEADCDLESTDDDEPSLGWTERGGHGSASYLAPNLPAGDVLDLEMDNCDDEEGGDAEPCPDVYGESVIWPDDLKSQEVLVSLRAGAVVGFSAPVGRQPNARPTPKYEILLIFGQITRPARISREDVLCQRS